MSSTDKNESWFLEHVSALLRVPDEQALDFFRTVFACAFIGGAQNFRELQKIKALDDELHTEGFMEHNWDLMLQILRAMVESGDLESVLEDRKAQTSGTIVLATNKAIKA